MMVRILITLVPSEQAYMSPIQREKLLRKAGRINQDVLVWGCSETCSDAPRLKLLTNYMTFVNSLEPSHNRVSQYKVLPGQI